MVCAARGAAAASEHNTAKPAASLAPSLAPLPAPLPAAAVAAAAAASAAAAAAVSCAASSALAAASTAASTTPRAASRGASCAAPLSAQEPRRHRRGPFQPIPKSPTHCRRPDWSELSSCGGGPAASHAARDPSSACERECGLVNHAIAGPCLQRRCVIRWVAKGAWVENNDALVKTSPANGCYHLP